MAKKKTPTWNYLLSEEAKSRYLLASGYLRKSNRILEIGSYETPIDLFLTSKHEWIRVVDPLIKPKNKNEKIGRVEYIQGRFQTVDFSDFTKKPFALVILGCSLKFDKKDPADKEQALMLLSRLVRKAERIVFEYAINWPNSQENAAFVKRHTKLPVFLDLHLDLGKQKSMEPMFAKRRFLVFQKNEAIKSRRG